MSTPIIMPKFEMAQESGTIARWLKRVGEPVSKGEAVLEVETDKITMEVESPASGVLGSILAEAGVRVPIGQPIAYIVAPGESLHVQESSASTDQPQNPAIGVRAAGRATPIAQKLASEHGIDLREVAGTGRDGQITRQDVEAFLAQRRSGEQDGARLAAAPAALRLARELGVDLATVQGSGPGGRIQSSDVERAAALWRESGMRSAEVSQPVASGSTGSPAVRRTIPLTGMRRTIAQRMSQSTREAPQFNLSVDVNMARVLAVVDDWRATR